MILILGSTGYIGEEFKRQLDELKIETLCISREDYDYYDLEKLQLSFYEPIKDDKTPIAAQKSE